MTVGKLKELLNGVDDNIEVATIIGYRKVNPSVRKIEDGQLANSTMIVWDEEVSKYRFREEIRFIFN